MTGIARSALAVLALCAAAAAQSTPPAQPASSAPPTRRPAQLTQAAQPTQPAQPMRLASLGAAAHDAAPVAGHPAAVTALHAAAWHGTQAGVPGGAATGVTGGSPGGALAASACGSSQAFAYHGQSVPTGGTLDPGAFFNPATVGNDGRLAFFSQISGAVHNQGIFSADAGGLHPLALGSGQGGGSGDTSTTAGTAAPGGGFFTGMFGGTFFAPATSAGRVLFMSDVKAGSTPRGLYLEHNFGGKSAVAVVGGPSPLGGTFSEVGPGSINAAGIVVFLARTGASPDVNIFRWSAGTTSKLVAVGDPAPGGGTYTMLGTETLGFTDGTTIPVGPLPAINDAGQVAFRAVVGSEHRLVVIKGGVHVLYARSGDPTPAGGTYDGFQGPHLNRHGEIAFFADFQPTPGNFSSGLFVGEPGNWRKAVSFFDPLPDGGLCFGLAFSRNPMTPLDDAGNFLFWTNAQLAGGAEQERLLVSYADGTLETIAAKSDPTPIGGTLGTFQAWPSMRNGLIGVSASTPGAAGGALGAHFALEDALTWEDLGFALAGTAGPPRLRGEGTLAAGTPGALKLDRARPLAPTWLISGLDPALVPFKGGTLVPDNSLPPLLAATDAAGTLELGWASWPAGVPACREIFFQAWIVDPAGPKGAAASNGLLGRTP
jgi:hypothetical protein